MVPTANIIEIPLTRIKAHRSLRYSEEDSAYMDHSIRLLGLLKPLTVVKIRTNYKLIDGAARYASHKRLKKEKAWCLVLPFGPDTSEVELAYIDANIVRSVLTPEERDAMYRARQKLIEKIDPPMAPDQLHERLAELAKAKAKAKAH